MKKTVLQLSLLTVFVISAASQTIVTTGDLQLKANKLLLEKDLRAYADELAQSKQNDVDSLLLRLEIFERAGQTERIRQTVVQLAQARDLPPVSERKWILEIVRGKISQDLPGLRIYYERLTEDDGYYSTNQFTQLWATAGDEKELEVWLTKKAVIGTSWFNINLERRLKLGTAQPIIDELAARVRENPNDKNALSQYLQTVKHAQEYSPDKQKKPFENETDWLADIFQAQNAAEAYEYGSTFNEVNPVLAIKYYRQSLASQFTPEDIQRLEQKYQPFNSVGGQRKINWEPQLRYWTKQKLAAAYQWTNQAYLAQPLIEQLVADKTDDISSTENFQLAGMVQSGSGARTIEAKILQDEGARSNSLEYWEERLEYFKGRRESLQMVQTFREGLAKIPAQDKDRFINSFESIYKYDLRLDELKLQLSEILLDEFNRVPINSGLAFEIVRAASPEEFGLKNFEDDVFVRRQNLLRPLFENRLEWDNDEQSILESVLGNESLSSAQKAFYIAELEKLALRGPVGRILDLEEVFKQTGEHSRRAPLLLEFLRRTSNNAKNEDDRNGALWSLFDAYIQSGQWQSAEKLLLDRQPVFLGNWGYCLQMLAICAGRQNATRDALRIWLKAVNFSGHSNFGLNNLAETPAKPLLREYYLQMKKREPDSPIPDAALKILR